MSRSSNLSPASINVPMLHFLIVKTTKLQRLERRWRYLIYLCINRWTEVKNLTNLVFPNLHLHNFGFFAHLSPFWKAILRVFSFWLNNICSHWFTFLSCTVLCLIILFTKRISLMFRATFAVSTVCGPYFKRICNTVFSCSYCLHGGLPFSSTFFSQRWLKKKNWHNFHSLPWKKSLPCKHVYSGSRFVMPTWACKRAWPMAYLRF